MGSKLRKLIYSERRADPTRGQNTSERERHSFVLLDKEILTLAKWARAIEAHYGRPMEIEWAKDGYTGKLYVVQARPETVPSRHAAVRPQAIAETRTDVMLNMSDPAEAFRRWHLPADGIGLARMEVILANHVKIHPMAAARFGELKDRNAKRAIAAFTRGHTDRAGYFVDRLAQGVGRLAASQFPRPVILRLSDFKTDEYTQLIGGAEFGAKEPNPSSRGVRRYYESAYRDAFALECRAIKQVRDRMGLSNVLIMIPFCRTLEECDLVLAELASHGLRRGENGLEIYVMCEIPSNVRLADQFAERFDGFSIGSDNLTRLTLGMDGGSATLSHLFNEDNPAVKKLIGSVIASAHRKGVHVGICGQAPGDKPAFARFLVEAGIDSISVTPESFLAVKTSVADAEKACAARRSGGFPRSRY
jgi:pyruvate,water dikinase